MSNNEGTMPIFSSLCILTMGLFIVYVLGSKALASSPIFVTILVFAAIIVMSAAISSSAVMAMPKGDCCVPTSESL
ncbi:hypothetical protein F5883DRAFT_656610 [Diaporthe sp. PMI_573]|nr:hypothetical protein F5883DRAFT_656610 [Diaporthaceae sp. PMI_573]